MTIITTAQNISNTYPKATTREPKDVMSPSSDGEEIKLDSRSDLNDLSMLAISGGSMHSRSIGVMASPNIMSLSD